MLRTTNNNEYARNNSREENILISLIRAEEEVRGFITNFYYWLTSYKNSGIIPTQ